MDDWYWDGAPEASSSISTWIFGHQCLQHTKKQLAHRVRRGFCHVVTGYIQLTAFLPESLLQLFGMYCWIGSSVLVVNMLWII